MDPQFKIVDKIDKHGWIRAQMKKSITARDTNYQTEQAKIAVGSGGPMGVGLMQGRQKLFYLPEAHTDTIYAVVGRRVRTIRHRRRAASGFVVILWRGIRATVLIPDEFGRYLGAGRHHHAGHPGVFQYERGAGHGADERYSAADDQFRRQFAAGDAGSRWGFC